MLVYMYPKREVFLAMEKETGNTSKRPLPTLWPRMRGA